MNNTKVASRFLSLLGVGEGRFSYYAYVKSKSIVVIADHIEM